MRVSPTDAERIADYVLATFDDIVGISIMDMRGNILAASSKKAFREAFAVTPDRAIHGGTLAFAILGLVNAIRTVFGGAKAIITIHENCKLMLLPAPSFQLLIGLVLQQSVNAEDHKIVSDIEMVLADILNHSGNNIW